MSDAHKFEQFIRPKLTNQAWERYCRVKMAHPERADQALAILYQSIKNNSTIMVNDSTLRQLLGKLHGKK